jgi:hypothetical protein
MPQTLERHQYLWVGGRCATEEALLMMFMRYPFGLAMTCVAHILVAEPRDYPVQVRPSV